MLAARGSRGLIDVVTQPGRYQVLFHESEAKWEEFCSMELVNAGCQGFAGID
jgi:hypothetical protein